MNRKTLKYLDAGLLMMVLVGSMLPDAAGAHTFRAAMIPNPSNDGWCNTCHIDEGARNAFGLEVEARVTVEGREVFWGPDLAALDSDGDGYTNGEELGDPYGLWVEGDPSPGLRADMGNPGDMEIVPRFHAAPQEWPAVTATPDSLVILADYSNQLGDLRVVFETPLETMDDPARLLLDASALGAEVAIPFDRMGDAVYAANGTVTPARSGWFVLPILLETDRGDTYLSHYLRVVVFPTREVPLFGDDDLSSEWSTASSALAEYDPEATASVFEGRTSLAVQPKMASNLTYLTWTPHTEIFGYRLHLAFQPVELDEAGDPPSLEVRIEDAIDEDLTVVPLLSGEEASLDVHDLSWQTATVHLGDRPVKSIVIAGNLKGTFHLDDIRLVPLPYELPPTAVLEQRQSTAPDRFGLDQNYPNPFNGGTAIRFALPTSDLMEIAIYNLAGQKVLSLLEGSREAGDYTLFWDGLDAEGRTLASGVYLYRLQTRRGLAETRTLVLIK